MGMDFLRSAYTQRVRYDASDPSKTTICRWYRAAPTAKVFPFEHAFGSPTWDQEKGIQTAIGFDATAPRTYSNGKRTNTSDGTKFAGPAEFFRTGQGSAPAIALGVNATPVDCIRLPAGIALGGGGQLITGNIPCPCYGRSIPATVNFSMTNTGTVFPFNCVIPNATGRMTFDPNFKGFGGANQFPNGAWVGRYTQGGNAQGVAFGCGILGPTVLQGAWDYTGGAPFGYYLQNFLPYPGPRAIRLTDFYNIGGPCAANIYRLDLNVSW